MGKTNTPESPLEATAGVAGQRASDAFELLANETRLAILLALWDAYEPFEESSGLTFSELRDRVGMRDSGQFNYHLGKLEGVFVTSTESGYKLRPAGEKLTRAVIGGAGLETPSLEPTELGMPCPLCDSPTEITYRDGRLFQRCTECEGKLGETDELPPGTLFIWRLEPAGLANRTPQEVYTAASIGSLQVAGSLVEGICPECSGPIEKELKICEEHEPVADGVCPNCGRKDEFLTFFQCAVCKFSGIAAPSDLVSYHPEVIAFYYDHGVKFQYGLDYKEVTRVWELEGAHEQTLVSRDPIRIRVTIQYEGDELELMLDKDMNVLDTGG